MSIPDIREYSYGDVYEYMNNGQHEYPACVLTINSVTVQGDDYSVSGNLFYIDRLLVDSSNKEYVQSAAISTLNSVVNKLYSEEYLSPSNRVYTPFTEKFGDLCGGAYLSFNISGLGEGICEDPYVQKVLSITKNGMYDVSGYDIADVDVQPELQSKSVTIEENGAVTIIPDEGYYLDSVEVVTDVQPELQSKSVVVTKNDSVTSIIPDDGYYGLKGVSVEVSIPVVHTPFEDLVDAGYSVGDIADITEDLYGTACDTTVTAYSDFNPETTTSLFYRWWHNTNMVFAPNIDTSKVTSMVGTLYGCTNLVYVPDWDYSSVLSLEKTFISCVALPTIGDIIAPVATTAAGMFASDTKLSSVGKIELPSCTTTSYMFRDCSSLKAAPELVLGSVKDMSYMFCGCLELSSVPLFDTSTVTNFNYMFGVDDTGSYNKLVTFTDFDLSSAESMKYMFSCSTSLESVSFKNMNSATNLHRLFNYCIKLTEVKGLNTSGATDADGLFDRCYELKSTPELDLSSLVDGDYLCNSATALEEVNIISDTPNLTSCMSMFGNCSKLKTIPVVNFSKCKSLQYLFNYDYMLTELPLLDFSSANSFYWTFYQCESLTTVAGFTNLGKGFTYNTTVDMQYCPLSSDSITNIANTVYDMNNSSYTATLKLKSDVYAALTDEQKELFANKKWTLTK